MSHRYERCLPRAFVLAITVSLLAAVGTVPAPAASSAPSRVALRVVAPLMVGPAVMPAAPPAEPIVLSAANASGPGVAVGTDGTTHIGWLEEDSEGNDTVVYCRLPRGANTCDTKETFSSPGLSAFDPVDVVLADDDIVQVLAYFCCGTNEGSQMFESLDGGDSFAPARLVGTIPTGDTVQGPGLNTVMAAYSGSAGPPGAGVQVQPTDGGFATQYAYLRDGDNRFYTGGVGLIDELTPISAYTDLDHTYIRQYDATSGGDYNDEANWLPSQQIVDENDPTIVTGAAGTYVMTHLEVDDNALKDAYQVRRISAADGTLAEPIIVTDIGPPIFGTMTADDAGGLTAVWTEAGDPAPIRSAYSVDGQSFAKPATLVEKARAYNIRLATAGDGGGVVVWDEQSAGRVLAVPIPVGGAVPDEPTHVGGFDPAANTPKCQRTVTIKTGVVAAAQGGPCFTEISQGRWRTKSDVNVNGIKFVGGKSTTTITVDQNKHTIEATAGVVQMAGPIVLSKDAGTFDVDGVTAFQNLDAFKIKLFDFPAVGDAAVRFQQGHATVVANLALPKPFDRITGSTKLTTTMAKGLQLTGIRITAKNLTIGEFELKTLDVLYDRSSSTFNGDVELSLPPNGAYVGVLVGFTKGKLVKLALTYKDGAPFPFTIYPGVWVTGVGFTYDGTDGFALGGGADFAVPTPEGPIAIDAIGSPPGTGGGFRFAMPNQGPASLDLRGDLKLFDFNLGTSTAHFDTSGLFNFKSTIDIGFDRLGMAGDVAGEVNLDDGTFFAETVLEICVLFCAEGAGVISDVGVAACASIDFGLFQIAFLVGYKWQGGIVVGTTCDTGPFKAPPSGSTPSPDGPVLSGDGTLYLPDNGDPTSFSVNIPGVGGPPLVQVRDAYENLVVQTDPIHPDEPQQGDHAILVASPASNSARVVLITDGDGFPDVYRITAQDQGRPLVERRIRLGNGEYVDVAAITVAESHPATEVAAKVTGNGRKKTVAWTASNMGASGRSVHFVETSAAGINHPLVSRSVGKGQFEFTVSDGAAGTRSIEAVVINAEGTAISQTPVTTFKAPGFELPAKPTKLKLSVSKEKLKVTWKGSRAKFSLVRAEIEDGRRLVFHVTGNKLVIPAVSAREKVTVTVEGVNALGRSGPTAKAKR